MGTNIKGVIDIDYSDDAHAHARTRTHIDARTHTNARTHADAHTRRHADVERCVFAASWCGCRWWWRLWWVVGSVGVVVVVGCGWLVVMGQMQRKYIQVTVISLAL